MSRHRHFERRQRRGGAGNRSRQPGTFSWYVGDNYNGWPSTDTAISTVHKELDISVDSQNRETEARLGAIQKALDFNKLLRYFPFNLLAKLFGISPWRYQVRRRRATAKCGRSASRRG